MFLERRSTLKGCVAASVAVVLPASAVEEELKSVSWSATDGFDSDFPSQIDFIEFDEKAYKAMRDDPRRTPKFAKAMKKRIKELGEDAVILDLGTGPFCVLALIAAEYGAKKVYAVEANAEVARRAKLLINECERLYAAGSNSRNQNGAIPLAPGRIEVIEGFSTVIDLPEKADLCVFEICGSLASEEGLIATMTDAKKRHLKFPDAPESYIPQRCQTYAAPVSYALQNLLTPPSYDWSKLGATPIRFNCRDEALQLLAKPQLLEDIAFADNLPSKFPASLSKKNTFQIDDDVIATSEANYLKAFSDQRQLQSLLIDSNNKPMAPGPVANDIASKFSGMAFWPTLILDDTTQVISRGTNGEAQKSHWQTVLQLMVDTPKTVTPGGVINIDFDSSFSSDVTKATTYSLKGSIK